MTYHLGLLNYAQHIIRQLVAHLDILNLHLIGFVAVDLAVGEIGTEVGEMWEPVMTNSEFAEKQAQLRDMLAKIDCQPVA